MVKDEKMFKVTNTEISLLEVTTTQEKGVWYYSKPGPWFKGEMVGEFYALFLSKVRELKEEKRFSQATTLLCNAGHAIELVIHGVITPEMMQSTEVSVNGYGGDLTTMVVIPTQPFVIDGEPVCMKIVIVDCFSYKSFTFIDDETNSDL